MKSIQTAYKLLGSPGETPEGSLIRTYQARRNLLPAQYHTCGHPMAPGTIFTMTPGHGASGMVMICPVCQPFTWPALGYIDTTPKGSDDITAAEYHRLAMRTKGDFGSQEAEMARAALGLAGEAGELFVAVMVIAIRSAKLAGLIEHAVYHGRKLDILAVLDEAGDVEWNIRHLIESLALELGMPHVLRGNLHKLAVRYNQRGFTNADSAARVDLQVLAAPAENRTVEQIMVDEQMTEEQAIAYLHRLRSEHGPRRVQPPHYSPARLNHAAAPFMREADSEDAPGPEWFVGNWMWEAYWIQLDKDQLSPEPPQALEVHRVKRASSHRVLTGDGLSHGALR
jgi:hypothetical protein